MTSIKYNTDLYAAHAALSERIEAVSLYLDSLEQRRELGADYEQANAELERLFDERAAVEKAILDSPLGDHQEIAYRGVIIARIGETYPQRAADLLRQMADQANKWAADNPMIWFKSGGRPHKPASSLTNVSLLSPI